MPCWTIKKTTWKGKPAELLTFTGTTEAEFDEFLDARFAPGREPAGPKTDATAKMGSPLDENGKPGKPRWYQYRRLILAPDTCGPLLCNECKAPTPELERFPGGICLACHAKAQDGKPLERPDFAGTVNI